jgi:biotin operon repressor
MRIGPRPATFERWTAEDEVLLQAMLDAKTDLDLIARKLRRSRTAIEKRIMILRKKRELGV